jgi:hypothetical protein
MSEILQPQLYTVEATTAAIESGKCSGLPEMRNYSVNCLKVLGRRHHPIFYVSRRRQSSKTRFLSTNLTRLPRRFTSNFTIPVLLQHYHEAPKIDLASYCCLL